MLILASASPARLALLQAAGYAPDHVIPADIDETPKHGEKPSMYVKRLAQEKAASIRATHPDAFIIAADTVAVLGGKIIGKAADRAEAEKIIKSFGGRRHRVLTGLCIDAPNGKRSTKLITSIVKCRKVPDAELQDYLDSGEWEGKSGCYGLQGRASAFIEWINGSYTGIIGLPVSETISILNGMGYKK